MLGLTSTLVLFLRPGELSLSSPGELVGSQFHLRSVKIDIVLEDALRPEFSVLSFK